VAECEECGKDCDDCEMVKPFTVEVGITATIDEDGEVSLVYEDDEIDIYNTVEDILTKLSEKYKENKVKLELSWSGYQCRKITFLFEQGLRLEAEWEAYYRGTFVKDATHYKSIKHLGHVGAYQLGDFIVDYLDKVYLTSDERVVKDVIE